MSTNLKICATSKVNHSIVDSDQLLDRCMVKLTEEKKCDATEYNESRTFDGQCSCRLLLQTWWKKIRLEITVVNNDSVQSAWMDAKNVLVSVRWQCDLASYWVESNCVGEDNSEFY